MCCILYTDMVDCMVVILKERYVMCRKQRVMRAAGILLAVVIFGLIYLWFFTTFGVGIPCIFNRITGLLCPGCGMTHAIAELCKGDIRGALGYNALVVDVFPVLCLYLLYRAVRYINGRGEGFYIWEYALLIILFIITVGYGLLRNLIT